MSNRAMRALRHAMQCQCKNLRFTCFRACGSRSSTRQSVSPSFYFWADAALLFAATASRTIYRWQSRRARTPEHEHPEVHGNRRTKHLQRSGPERATVCRASDGHGSAVEPTADAAGARGRNTRAMRMSCINRRDEEQKTCQSSSVRCSTIRCSAGQIQHTSAHTAVLCSCVTESHIHHTLNEWLQADSKKTNSRSSIC